MKIGILALQGAFVEHEKMLAQLGVESIELRNLEDFQQHQSDLSGVNLARGRVYNYGETVARSADANSYKRGYSQWFTSLWNLCGFNFASETNHF